MTPNPPRASDRICAGCARPAVGYGIVAKYKTEVLWCCGEPDCYLAVQGTYDMNPREFDRLDTLAAERGGEEGGAYLEELGKFSLETLTPQEYGEYVRRVIAGYRHALHVELREAVPF
jgi:hypothetical protein